MRGTAPARQQAQLLVIGMALLALALGFFFFITQSAPPRGARILGKALAQLEQRQSYALTIIETAPRYELSFQGRVEGGNRLEGSLPEYNLEVLSAEGRVRLRPEEGEAWVTADTLGLQGLTGFLVTPLELLQGGADHFPRALAGEEITLGGSACQTLCFAISDPEELVQRLFPQIDPGAISEVTVGAALAGTALTLRQLRVLVEFTDPGGEKIERSYYLDD